MGIYFFHVLSHEAELRDAVGIQLLLIAKGHRFKRQDGFADFIHWLNCFLESRRGSSDAELAICVYYYRAAGYRHAGDPGYKGAVLRPLLANTNFIGLSSAAQHVSSDIDIVTACG